MAPPAPMTPPAPEGRKRPIATNSYPPIGPPHGGKHAELCEHLRKKQVSNLAHVADRGTGLLGWFATTFTDLAYYWFVWFPKTWWLTLTSLPGFLLDPFGMLTALVFPIVGGIALFVTLIISAVWRLPVVQEIWRPISNKKGVGLANFVYPLIFDFGARPQNKLIRDAAFTVMSEPLTHYAQPSSDEERNFDLEISKILMLLSALVYERDVGVYHEAARSIKRSKELNKKLLVGPDTLTDAGKDAYKKLGDADGRIREVANEWGFNYSSVSELASNTSPVCGAFWNPDYNFIILAFKGTNPVEFKEWAIDLTFTYTDGRSWLPGFTKVHSGFYDQIFPRQLNHATGSFPYTEIRTSVSDIARQIRETTGRDHVNLYVTGHSLGAALASVFYARAIASPKDFGQKAEGGNQVVVRDAYCFGTPIIGDPDCISAFNQSFHDQDLDHPQALWRITNRRDSVATTLPDFGDYNMLRHISPTSQLHFAHIGQEMQLTSNVRKVYTGPGTMLPKKTIVNIVTHLDKGGEGPSVVLPPYFQLLERIPGLGRVFAHFPSSYWARLCRVHSEYELEYRSWH